MIYRVSWEPGAFQMLQQIWDEQDEPAELIHTLDEIHGILSVDAEQQGES